MKLSSDIDLLIALARSEVIGKRICGVSWAYFSDRLSLDFDGPTGSGQCILLGPIGWKLTTVPMGEVIASNATSAFEEYAPEAERLVGSTITNFRTSAETDLAMELEFSCGLMLRTDPCGPVELDDPVECWSVWCSDDHVILAGIRQGKWARVHKDQPFSDRFEIT